MIPGFKATAIDIDGDNSTLNEWVTFYSFNAYTVESITAVTVTNVTDNLAGNLLTSGKRFDGSSNLYTAGVDTSETTVMTTVTYNTSNTVKLRVGGTKTANSNMTNRMSLSGMNCGAISMGSLRIIIVQLMVKKLKKKSND